MLGIKTTKTISLHQSDRQIERDSIISDNTSVSKFIEEKQRN